MRTVDVGAKVKLADTVILEHSLIIFVWRVVRGHMIDGAAGREGESTGCRAATCMW
jgi:hypothetical protein